MAIEDDVSSSRRKFLKSVAGAGVMVSLPSRGASDAVPDNPLSRVPIVYFSKHLQWLNWEQMAETAAELGFDGIDLTVREGGHVQPERVKEDLPKVARIVRKAGLDIPMITAGIVDIHSPHAEDIIRTARRARNSSLPVGLVLLVGHGEGPRSYEFPRQPWQALRNAFRHS